MIKCALRSLTEVVCLFGNMPYFGVLLRGVALKIYTVAARIEFTLTLIDYHSFHFVFLQFDNSRLMMVIDLYICEGIIISETIICEVSF